LIALHISAAILGLLCMNWAPLFHQPETSNCLWITNGLSHATSYETTVQLVSVVTDV